MKYNKNTFFYLENGKIVACHSLSQDYYELDLEHFKRLIEKSKDLPSQASKDKIDQDLSSGGLLSDKLDDQLQAWEGDPISFYCHQGTRIYAQNSPVLDEDSFCEEFIKVSSAVKEIPPKGIPDYVQQIKLPDPDLSIFRKSSFYDVIKKRKTSRNFDPVSLDLKDLSSLLYLCFGPIHGTVWEDFEQHHIPSLGQRRSSPSATGLQGCDAYLVILNANDIEQGIYYYASDAHTLYRLKNTFDDRSLVYALGDQFWAKNLSAGLFIVNDMRRTWIKDKKARGYLAAYLEAGHLSQTILLTATALGLHTWITGSFRDDVVEEKLQLKNSPCFASFFIGLGFGDNGSIPEKFIKTISSKTL